MEEVTFRRQSAYITTPRWVPEEEWEYFEVRAVLKHWKRGKWYEFFILMKGGPTYKAAWQPKGDCEDSAGTLRGIFREYIITHKLYPELVEEDFN